MSKKTIENNRRFVIARLAWFNALVENELSRPKNLRKRQWPKCEDLYLHRLLQYQVDSLSSIEGPKEIIRTCAKVAGLAMMIADNASAEETIVHVQGLKHMPTATARAIEEVARRVMNRPRRSNHRENKR